MLAYGAPNSPTSECAVILAARGRAGVFVASSRQGRPNPPAGKLVSAGRWDRSCCEFWRRVEAKAIGLS